jgi:hypothetical protein
MAIPPDPIDEVLPTATAAVMAAVTCVVTQDPQPPLPAVPEGFTGAQGQVARQVVELEISEVLFGDLSAGKRIVVEKPAGEYALSAGNTGPFLLQQTKVTQILGRYGPATYSRELIVGAARRAGRVR